METHHICIGDIQILSTSLCLRSALHTSPSRRVGYACANTLDYEARRDERMMCPVLGVLLCRNFDSILLSRLDAYCEVVDSICNHRQVNRPHAWASVFINRPKLRHYHRQSPNTGQTVYCYHPAVWTTNKRQCLEGVVGIILNYLESQKFQRIPCLVDRPMTVSLASHSTESVVTRWSSEHRLDGSASCREKISAVAST